MVLEFLFFLYRILLSDPYIVLCGLHNLVVFFSTELK
jgi:hypothetical protein